MRRNRVTAAEKLRGRQRRARARALFLLANTDENGRNNSENQMEVLLIVRKSEMHREETGMQVGKPVKNTAKWHENFERKNRFFVRTVKI